MTPKFLRLCFALTGLLFFIHAGGSALARDPAKSVDVFVDLDGDGFDDNGSDVNKDGLPDLVCPVKAPAMLASANDLFGGQSIGLPQKPVHVTKAQSFGLRQFVTRSLCLSRCSLTLGFNGQDGAGTAVGAEACPGGNCGI